MAERTSSSSKPAERWQRDAERNERVRRARVRRDHDKSPGTNLEQGSAFVRFAHEFAAAFEKKVRPKD